MYFYVLCFALSYALLFIFFIFLTDWLSYYVVIVNVFSVILLYFMFMHFILYCGQL